MIDVFFFLALVVAMAGVLLLVWRWIAGSRRAGARRWVRRLVASVAAIALSMAVVYLLGRARSVQLFGEVIPRVDVADSVVALTFDDGPTPEATARVLAMLEAEDVRASFFLIGRDMQENPSAAEAIVRAGHEVGNHSETHEHMAGMSLERISGEIERTDTLLRNAGYKGPIHFRSPYCWKLAALPWHLERTGRRNITFDVEPESDPTVDGNTERIVADVLARTRPGSIILLHVMYPSREPSLAAVPAIIRGLKRKGYRFVTVSELLAHGR